MTNHKPSHQPDQPQHGDDPKVQGEGDYEANRRYRESAEQFAQQSDKVEQAAQDAAPDSAEEAEQLSEAEAEGRARAKR